MPAIRGKVIGGDTPIVGATVILWETDPANSGYGVATNGSSTGAQQLATTTTGSGGSFTFIAGSYTCASGEFAYITATGGSVNGSPLASGGLANTNYIQISALGSCSHFDNSSDESKISIAVNEITTVAAAYTLGNFMTINDTTPGSQLVYIGAPAKNNAATGSCTGTGASMSCTAAGLSHAFANFANLVDAVHYDGTTPTGLAWTVTPTNSLGSVPQAMVNSLADIVAACVNSGGGVAGDNATQCGYLFTDATPTGGTSPTETLAALVDIAKYPQHNVGTTCTGATTLYCLIPGQPAFSPTLTTAPHDWALAITYSGMSPSSSSPYNASTATVWGVPLYLTLDANDNVYVAASNNGTDASASTAGEVFGMASNGAGIWATAPSTASCLPSYITTDANGNVFTVISISSSTNPISGSNPCENTVNGYGTATGASTYTFYPTSQSYSTNNTLCTSASQPCVSSTPFGIGADRFNNLWLTRHASCTSGSCFAEFPYTSGTGYGPNANAQTSSTTQYGTQVLTDAQGNIYEGIYQETNAVISVTPNTNTSGTRASAPTYTAATGNFATTDVSTEAYGLVALDAVGNVYTAVADAVLEYTPVYTSGVMTGLGSPTTISNGTYGASKPFPGEFDGGGRLWTPSNSSSGQYYFWDISASSTGIQAEDIEPCAAANGAATCTIASEYPKVIQVDSTGALWAADAGASSTTSTPYYVQQVFGVGAPAWPQMSYGVFETKPQ